MNEDDSRSHLVRPYALLKDVIHRIAGPVAYRRRVICDNGPLQGHSNTKERFSDARSL